MNKLKIIFVGTPDMALVCLSNLLEKKFNIVGVVPPKREHETFSYFEHFCQDKGLNFIPFNESPNEKSNIEKIKELNADIGVVCSYNMRFSQDFINTTKMGYINCHPSLLPQYRGAVPYFHIVNNGEKISGITLHFMDETFDTGDIVYQEKFELLPWETMGTIFNRTTYMISDALIKVLSEIENTGTIKRTPQPKGENYITANRTDGNFRIRWNKSIFELERLIRACNPFYNAFSNFRNVSMKILKASAIKASHNLKFGQIAKADENELLVAAKDGYISIEILHLGTWGIFNPKEFYCTFKPNTQEILI